MIEVRRSPGMSLHVSALFATILTLSLIGCSGNNSKDFAPVVDGPADSNGGEVTVGSIKVNQIGFLPNQSKIAIVPGETEATEFHIVDIESDTVVFSGDLSAAATWAPAEEAYRQADFSAATTPGTYRVAVEGLNDSPAFTVAADIYGDVHDAALKSYYFNRASMELEAEHAGTYARAPGHPDTNVLIHASAASQDRPEGTVISAAKGWYDAGDYNKYIVNSGISTYNVLAAYEHFPEFYNGRDINIPESGNSVPDILDEARWNLEWMLDMQDPFDGGVYHKLTALNFAGVVMPADATAQRYVVQKGTAATLDFAAVMATASRIYRPFDPALADYMEQAAIDAWQWAQDNSDVPYQQPADVTTGGYGDSNFNDEFAWAAAELFILTGEQAYLDAFAQRNQSISIPSWPNVAGLAFISLAQHGDALADDMRQSIESSIISLADTLVSQQASSAIGVPMATKDFRWGNNGDVASKAQMLIQAYRISGDDKYLPAAYALTDYLMGRNGTDYSFITGFGSKPPVDIHHRPSAADDVEAPVPGFLVGGPHSGWQDGCEYPSSAPAKSYLDDWCSYSTNEIAINWNAPFVYILGAINAMNAQ